MSGCFFFETRCRIFVNSVKGGSWAVHEAIVGRLKYIVGYDMTYASWYVPIHQWNCERI